MGSDSAFGEPFYTREKAWCVEDEYHGNATIVFASTRGKARALGARRFDMDFTDTSVQRVPWADGLARDGDEVDWHDKDNAFILRSRGWWYDCGTNDEAHLYCEKCGLHSWAILPLSLLDGDCVCGYCREAVHDNDDTTIRR